MQKKKVFIIGFVIVVGLLIFFFPKTYVRPAVYTEKCDGVVREKCIGMSMVAPSSNECLLTDVCFGWSVPAR